MGDKIMTNSFQVNKWTSEFGKEYTDRNIYSPQQLDEFYMGLYGVKCSDMNKQFLQQLDMKEKRILEVGCNVGNQLRMLQSMGYKNLYGVEIQDYAVEKAKELTTGINIIKGSGMDIPFKDGYFDMVFTSGVLIHICPNDITKVLSEIYRCSGKYIWGLEYYADEYTEISYRGQNNLLWKANFAKLYKQQFPGLELIKEEKFKYVNEPNVDSMFLLEKSM